MILESGICTTAYNYQELPGNDLIFFRYQDQEITRSTLVGSLRPPHSSCRSRATHISESRSTRTWEWICWIRCLSDVAETWWEAGGIFACPDTGSFSARCQNREGHSTLAIHTTAFVHVLVLLAAGFSLCFGESINLT
jgi:hypothetical protein